MKKLLFSFLIVTFTTISAFSQKQQSSIPLIGSKAPSFTANTTEGKIKFPDDYGSNWKILFSHPQDFTPVCTSELLELAYLQKKFDNLGVKIAVISTDNVEQHKLWKSFMEDLDYKGHGKQKINFPIIEDTNASISKQYGMLHQPSSSNKDIRGVFIIDENNIIRSINFYPMQVGRNFDEIVRTVEAIQTTEKQQVLTPANWNEGDDVLVPYFPYTKEELAANPSLKDDYYSLGDRVWFKKVKGSTNK